MLIKFLAQGEWEKAIGLFTEAIKINPNSAVMFAKRGMCYLKISPQATNACVKVSQSAAVSGVKSDSPPSGLLQSYPAQPGQRRRLQVERPRSETSRQLC